MLETYQTEDQSSWVTMFGDDSNQDKINLKTQLHKLSDTVSNPFINFWYWIKEETLDLQCLLEAISWKSSFEGKWAKLQSKIKSSSTDLDKLN